MLHNTTLQCGVSALSPAGSQKGADLQCCIDPLAKGCRHSVRSIAEQHSARGSQARDLQRAPAGVPGPLHKLLCNIPLHLLQGHCIRLSEAVKECCAC